MAAVPVPVRASVRGPSPTSFSSRASVVARVPVPAVDLERLARLRTRAHSMGTPASRLSVAAPRRARISSESDRSVEPVTKSGISPSAPTIPMVNGFAAGSASGRSPGAGMGLRSGIAAGPGCGVACWVVCWAG
ncbi:hypothetical protein AHiyo4_03690 [Arthrobacter sp. Hiyo4]|nr:hypothetical protein AHiyo4_03690 [Arthrobacter sp. Hiyo4]